MKKSDLKNVLKDVLRPLVLTEITLEPLKASPKYQEPIDLIKKLKQDVGDDARIEFSPESGKVVIEPKGGERQYSLQVSENGCDCYSVIAILDGSERACLKTANYDDIQKIIKDTIKNKDGKKYTEKAYSKNAIPEKKEKIKEKSEKDGDLTKETEGLGLKKQIDHKPIEPKDRDIEETTKGTTGMADSTKFKKLADIETKDAVKLKADKKNASDEKLVRKMDGTSKMKALKENIKECIKEVLKEGDSTLVPRRLNIGGKGGYSPDKGGDDVRKDVLDALVKKYNFNKDDINDPKSDLFTFYWLWFIFTKQGKEWGGDGRMEDDTIKHLKDNVERIMNTSGINRFTREFGIRDAAIVFIKNGYKYIRNYKDLKESIKNIIKKVLKESIKKRY
jgi:hypothetical protein